MFRNFTSNLLVCASGLAFLAQPALAQPNLCARAADGALEPAFQRTVVISDPAIFAADGIDFSLGRTLGAILTTVPNAEGIGAVDTPSERVALLTTLTRTFRVLDRENPESEVPMPASARPGEAALDPIDLLDPTSANFMKPIGLFNRIDLAPQNLRYCGEHRIVYGKTTASPIDRMFLIFEAALRNPDPNDRPAGCRRVAEFWDRMQGDMSVADRAAALAKFYYRGDLGDGEGTFDPVIHHAHYGVPFGQIRGNLFVTEGDPVGHPWMLREWRTSISAEGHAVFVPDTVKSNPHPALYANPAADEEQSFTDLRMDYRESFRLNHVRELVELELENPGQAPDAENLFARLSARFDNKFNSFESISQRPSDDPFIQATGTDLVGQIDRELRNYNLPLYSGLTAEHILNRAGALSCGGCHQLTVDKPIAPGVNWPASAEGGFVHIREDGRLSPALVRHFLPSRCENMQRIVAPSPGESAPDEAETPAVAAAEVQVQQALVAVEAAEGPIDKAEAVVELEERVENARNQDARSPGAFIPFRRTH